MIDRIASSALQEDPNIFDYDGAYDNIQKEKEVGLKAQFASKTTAEPPVSVFHISFFTINAWS